jgi:hypothetical protein
VTFLVKACQGGYFKCTVLLINVEPLLLHSHLHSHTNLNMKSQYLPISAFLVLPLLMSLVSCSYFWHNYRPGLESSSEIDIADSYEPRIFKSLDDLPPIIKDGLLKHLEKRLSVEFMKKLELDEGKFFDVGLLHKQEPRTLGYEWEVPAYILHFCAKIAPSQKCLYPQIHLRRDGTVIQEIELPAFSSHPERMRIISKEAAIKIAMQHGFGGKVAHQSDLELRYDRQTDSFLYDLCETVKDDGLTITYMCYEIDASMSFLRTKHEESAIR